MARLLATCLLVITLAGCGQAATPAPVPTVAAMAVPTAAPAKTTSVPTVAVTPTPPPLATTVFVAESYVRAKFARDEAAMIRAFPSSKPDDDCDEYLLQLDEIRAYPLTAEKAGDNNPVTRNEYAYVGAKVSAKGKSGLYTYTIGTRVENGRRVIGMVSRIADW